MRVQECCRVRVFAYAYGDAHPTGLCSDITDWVPIEGTELAHGDAPRDAVASLA